MYRRFGKRLLELTLVLTGLLLFWPLLMLLALLVRIKLGTPVLFRQPRSGQHGQPFNIIKFRTMTDARDDQGNLLSDAERITPFGRFLRSSSLDELPELLNVVTGEMSLVGPRPLLLSYLDRYSDEQRRRLEALPGITGWAQINGRNTLSWDERFALDVWYVDNQSLWLDLRILYLTIGKVFNREGIAKEGHATMPEFFGNKNSKS